MSRDLTDFIAGLPKAELHVHHVGSASPADRRRAGRPAPRRRCRPTPTRCADFFAFRDFAHFIEVYLAVVDLIRDARGRPAADLRGRPRDGRGQQRPVRRADLHAVHLACTRGIPIEAFSEAIEDARVAAERDFGIVLRWIFDIPGEAGLPAADDDARTRPRPRGPTGLVGFGLGGPEIGVPRPQFKPHFDAGPRGRAAQRAARRRDHRPADGLGRAPRCSAPSGSGTAPPSAQDPELLAHLAEHRHPAGGLPDLQHRHPRGRRRSTSTRCARSSTPA